MYDHWQLLVLGGRWDTYVALLSRCHNVSTPRRALRTYAEVAGKLHRWVGKRYRTYDREVFAEYLSTRHILHTVEGRFTTFRTDLKPLFYMFAHRTEKRIDHQI